MVHVMVLYEFEKVLILQGAALMIAVENDHERKKIYTLDFGQIWGVL